MNITRQQFIDKVHAAIGDNLKVKAAPYVREDGRLGAKATLEVGDIDTAVEALADELGFEPAVPEGEVIDGDQLTAGDEDDDDAKQD